jgi:hypothetical protein
MVVAQDGLAVVELISRRFISVVKYRFERPRSYHTNSPLDSTQDQFPRLFLHSKAYINVIQQSK